MNKWRGECIRCKATFFSDKEAEARVEILGQHIRQNETFEKPCFRKEIIRLTRILN